LTVKRKTNDNCFANFQYCLAVYNSHCSGHLLKNETEIWKYWVYHVYLSQFSSRGRGRIWLKCASYYTYDAYVIHMFMLFK
jgi:hypothetical protein